LNKNSQELAERENLIEKQEATVLAEREELRKLKEEYSKME